MVVAKIAIIWMHGLGDKGSSWRDLEEAVRSSAPPPFNIQHRESPRLTQGEAALGQACIVMFRKSSGAPCMLARSSQIQCHPQDIS